MSRLSILHYPDPRLRQLSKPVEVFDEVLEQLVADMAETMYEAPGVGLAAPQIGQFIRLLVYDPCATDEEQRNLRVVINPEILFHDGAMLGEEGCLSVPEYFGEVERAARITLRYQDLRGAVVETELEDLEARIVQHEMDHLDGVVFLDRMGPIKRDLLKRKIKKAIKAGSYATV
ncbi:MAG: peptide deformylase [Nitrospirota bacterium]|jgi:peptide deformylase